MGLISLIIPVYNAESYIERCLDSVINQTDIPPIEIIIVDDGSTDRTSVILEEYRRKYDFIKVISQKNQKQSAARNHGMQYANGDFIMFVDIDDYLEPNMLSLLYQRILNDGTDLAICGIRKIFKGRTETEIRSCLKDSNDLLGDYLCQHQEMDVGLWNKIFKRTIIVENDILFENGNFFEDTLFVFKYLCHIKNGISFIEEPLYNLFKREESTTTTYNQNIEQYALQFKNKIQEYITGKNLMQYSRFIKVLNTRLLIYIIHHNMKFNKVDKKQRVRNLLAQIEYGAIVHLPLKYRISILFLKISPRFYEKLYLSNKGV